jgi:hypothetical protein
VSVSRRKDSLVQVNGERGFFYCFGCGVGGDVIKFIELLTKWRFRKPFRQLASRLAAGPRAGRFERRRRGATGSRSAPESARSRRRVVPGTTVDTAGRRRAAAVERSRSHGRHDCTRRGRICTVFTRGTEEPTGEGRVRDAVAPSKWAACRAREARSIAFETG